MTDFDFDYKKALGRLTKLINNNTDVDEKKAAIYHVLTEMANALVEYPAFHATLTDNLKHIPLIDNATIKFETNVIQQVDKCLRDYCKGIKFTKYQTVQAALELAAIRGVLISINGTCYLFDTEEMYNIFLITFQANVLHGVRNNMHKLNIYHITPPNAKQKAILRYQSIDDHELLLVRKRLAEMSNTAINSITVHKIDDDMSRLVMHQKIGTYPELIPDLYDYKDRLASQYDDTKLDVPRKVNMGGIDCCVERVIPHSINENVVVVTPIINIIVNSPGASIAVDASQNKKEYRVLKSDKHRKSNTKLWIGNNPPGRKEETSDYHTRYTKFMKKKKMTCFAIQAFSKIVELMDYTRVRKQRLLYWQKNIVDSDDESEKSSSSDSE